MLLHRLAIAPLAPLLLLCPVISSSSSAQTAATASPTLDGDPAHPAAAPHWLETRLVFGLGPADAPRRGVSELRWRRFLDHEITPRFPSGLSVLDLYGQWQRAGASHSHPPQRIRSKMVLIDYPPTPENAARLQAIRSAWKSLTGDQSVMEVTETVDVSF